MNGSNDAMPADALRSIAMPDHIATPLGGLTFFDGLPDAATVSSSYDLLDLIRGIDVYLNTIPGASLVALRAGLRSVGVKDARTLAFTDPRSQFRELLPHAEHRDARTGRRSWICARTGRPSSRIRPESLCVVDDFWFRYVADLGMAGPDEGAGGKYLFLPPGWEGEVPEGYFVFRSPTFTNWLVVRALGGVPALKNTKVYPLAQADDPPPMTHLNIADTRHNTVHSNDFSYYEEIDALVQEEPVEALDPERAGRVAAIGIVKGKPFAPDERLRGLLAQAAPIAAGIARALVYKPRDPAVYLYPGSRRGRRPSWAGVTRSCGTGRDCSTPAPSSTTSPPSSPRRWRPRRSAPDRSTHTRRRTRQGPGWTAGAPTGRDCPPAFRRRTSGRWTCTTPSIPVAPADRQPLPGAEQPARNGHRQRRRLHRPPLRARRTRGQETNWIQTVPGKSWFGMLRLYGPLEPWFDGSWRPGEFEPVEGADGG